MALDYGDCHRQRDVGVTSLADRAIHAIKLALPFARQPHLPFSLAHAEQRLTLPICKLVNRAFINRSARAALSIQQTTCRLTQIDAVPNSTRSTSAAAQNVIEIKAEIPSTRDRF
jgi:hypothetical protein